MVRTRGVLKWGEREGLEVRETRSHHVLTLVLLRVARHCVRCDSSEL